MTVYILIILDVNVYSVAEIIWCSIMSITCVWITTYAFRVGKVLYITVQISQQQQFYESDWRDVKRLLTINGTLTLFFIFQTAIVIYFSATHQKLDEYFRIVDLFTNAVCLIVLCYLYRNPMKKMIKQNGTRKKKKKRRNSISVNKTNNCKSPKKSINKLDLKAQFSNTKTTSLRTPNTCQQPSRPSMATMDANQNHLTLSPFSPSNNPTTDESNVSSPITRTSFNSENSSNSHLKMNNNEFRLPRKSTDIDSELPAINEERENEGTITSTLIQPVPESVDCKSDDDQDAKMDLIDTAGNIARCMTDATDGSDNMQSLDVVNDREPTISMLELQNIDTLESVYTDKTGDENIVVNKSMDFDADEMIEVDMGNVDNLYE